MESSYSQWNDAAQWFDQNMGTTGDALNAAIIRPLVLDMLGDLGGMTVLDAGCGSGYLTAELAERAEKVTGTDFAPNFVALCKQKYEDRDNLDFVLHDIERPFPFAESTFDVVTCKMVLQYVRDIGPFGDEAMRLLKTKGKLVVVIDHPYRAVYFNAQHADKPVSSAEVFSDTPKTKIGLWGKTELTWYARTTSAYVQAFIDCGFTLVKMHEPPAPEANSAPFSVLALGFIKS